MPIYVPGKVTLRRTWQPMDPDSAAYITAVETADGQALEEKVKIAIDNFVLGCKADGIWSAIKASCILAGARTLSGALVPLVGAAPTNYNFVAGDYNRKTGLVGDGSAKYLNSNRNNNADPQNSKHLSCYVTEDGPGGLAVFMGSPVIENGASWLRRSSDNTTASQRINTGSSYNYANAFPLAPGLLGASRSTANQSSHIASAGVQLGAISSTTPADRSILLFSGVNPTGIFRIAFYSIGESLDLALLDARVTDLINAIGVAIP